MKRDKKPEFYLNLPSKRPEKYRFDCDQCKKPCKSSQYQQRFCNDPCTLTSYLKEQRALKKQGAKVVIHKVGLDQIQSLGETSRRMLSMKL